MATQKTELTEQQQLQKNVVFHRRLVFVWLFVITTSLACAVIYLLIGTIPLAALYVIVVASQMPVLILQYISYKRAVQARNEALQ